MGDNSNMGMGGMNSGPAEGPEEMGMGGGYGSENVRSRVPQLKRGRSSQEKNVRSKPH